jgi:membrane-bound lytic murein transglycosylase A
MPPASESLPKPFAALGGWSVDDHAAALASYASTVDLLGAGWPRPDGQPARRFFECNFAPRPQPQEALLTGYYEPELPGSLHPTPKFRYPLYAPPPSLKPGEVWHERGEIEDQNLLAGQELVWLDSALEAFLAQVQGSVRICLPDGTSLRFGYAAKNGHPYSSIGKELLRRGDLTKADCSVGAIRAWAQHNSGAVPNLLRINRSFVFFRKLDLPADTGPLGTMQRPVTPMRSLAVDPAHIPLGTPVWVAAGGINQLMIAQDTGSAIKGPGRGDVFFGTGAEAGARAGAFLAQGHITPLLPSGVPA